MSAQPPAVLAVPAAAMPRAPSLLAAGVAEARGRAGRHMGDEEAALKLGRSAHRAIAGRGSGRQNVAPVEYREPWERLGGHEAGGCSARPAGVAVPGAVAAR
jgi:hypothetical protein